MEDIRLSLTDECWEWFREIISGVKSRAGAPPETSDLEFVEAILYRARTGIPWRDLPVCFGAWDAVYQRFRRWEKLGIWQALFEGLPEEALEACKVLFLDSTVVRAHQHAAGACGKKGGSVPRRSVGAKAASPPKSIWRRPTKIQPLLSC